MYTELPRLLTLLRREKGQSQKDAAGALGVSQALLSHYEKGVRRPGLEFVVKAAGYYGVTTDYLLGVTSQRGETPPTEPESVKDNRGAVAVTLGRKYTTSAVNVLFGLMEDESYHDFAAEAQAYLAISLYKTFRHLYGGNKDNLSDFFKLPELAFLEAGNAAQQMCELRLKLLAARLASRRDKVPPITYDAIKDRYGQDAYAFFNVIKKAEEEITLGERRR